MADRELYILLASYATKAAAEADYKMVVHLERENDVVLQDAAVLERSGSGHIKIHKDHHHHDHKGYSKEQLKELARGLAKGENLLVVLSAFDLLPTVAPKLTGATEVAQQAVDVERAQLGIVFDQPEHTKLIGGVDSV